MRTVSQISYWLVGLVGTGIWTGAIISLTTLPLPAELALGGMGLVACIWGHSVLFPKERAAGIASAPGRMPREEAFRSTIAAAPPTVPLPTGTLRLPVARPPRNTSSVPPPGELPPLLRTPFEEAARMEAHRLAEAVTASGLFGPVNVRLEADGTAVVAPVASGSGVRLPADKLVRFAGYATLPDGLVEAGTHGGGSWPGADLIAAIDAHLATIAPSRDAAVPAAAQPVRAAEAQPRPRGLPTPRLAG
ncbi:hypothetical protein HB662_22900 [Roseomonas frigidaquae]|uniref:DUF308 domain-containing protein n=1 Tax=Falsiroseomonas frigidaquae TaxID=487318 RepID=A0ABX1F5H1_9PROT|nr:hypothetical protein [Falsiroseomonas frigidaquae]NKE47646.1 hypothetical protein [Falsiroseomonas frigidaquae]